MQLCGGSFRLIRTLCPFSGRINLHSPDEMQFLADLGPVGSLVRSSIRRVAPDLPPARSHRIAVQVLADLTGAGLVR